MTTKNAITAFAFLALGATPLFAQDVPTNPHQTEAPELPFTSIEFGQLPDNMYMGEASGVATDSHGNVYVFSRGNSIGPAYGATASQLLEFDSSGKFMREIGHNLYAWSFAHAVRIDPHDNIWVADKGSDMVVRFNQAGRVTLVLGRKTEASDENSHPWEHPNPPLPPIDGMFRQVTDMTWDPQGNIYVSDGYINSRVAKFDPEGNWLASYGDKGTGIGQFRTVHAIAADKDGNLYVADRGNRRIQVMDGEGHVKRIITIDIPAHNKHLIMYDQKLRGPNLSLFLPGAPWTVCITPPKAGSPQYLFAADAFRIFKMDLSGHVIGWLGGEGKGLKEFGWIHGLACPDEHTLYAGELVNWRVQKIMLQ